MKYDRNLAVKYALEYAIIPNNAYVYFQGNDCTNFISQCLKAGGALNDYNTTHPWWYYNGKASICWAVAHSLYWYIRTCSENQSLGIRANTYYLDNNSMYQQEIRGKVEIGDIIQYKNFENKIQHSTIITSFDSYSDEPLISQHTFEGKNISWRKNFKQTIFHHVLGVN
ncbi:MAG: amidase domain-containing protein [Eubacteriaceae bacterium]